MKRNLVLAVLSVILLGSLSSSFSTPSTQIWIPSTDIQPYLQPHVGWDAYLTTLGDGLINNGGLTMGVVPLQKFGVEVGVDYRSQNGFHNNPILFNVKAGVPENAFFKFMPAIAVGGYDFGLKKDYNNYDVVYGLLAEHLWKLGRFSLGAYKGLGPNALWTANNGKVHDTGMLISWDRIMSELSDKLWLAVDFQSGKNSYGALSFGAGWSFTQNVGLIVGYDVYNDSDAYDPTFTFQIDINLF